MQDLLKELLKEFDTNNIKYAHWKSNTNIDCALSGIDDFDVLVHPNNKEEVKELLKNFNFIRSYSNKDTWQNEIFHYIGMDIEQKKIVHIHLHFLLEVGYDFDKNANLPIIDKYLENTIRHKYVFIPEIEKEYILLVIRLILKNAFVPFILMLPTAQIRYIKNAKSNGIISGGGYREFEDLSNRMDKNKLEEILKDTFPFISIESFKEYEKTIQDNNSIFSYFSKAKKLKKELKNINNHSETKGFFYSLYRINLGRINTLCKNKIHFKKIPAHGGRIFAFVGGDGAGKSTNTEKLHNILKRYFYSEIIHVGRPKKHIPGTLLRITSKLLRISKITSLANAISFLAIAYDRKQEFKRALKIRRKGGIVILDRIPLEGITAMDCPRVHTINNNSFPILSKIENWLYSSIKNVDTIIALKLDPEIALQRRPEDDPDELRIRSGQIWEKDFSLVENAYSINTSNTFDYVEKSILKIVWDSITKKPKISEILGLAGSGKSTTKKMLELESSFKFDLEFIDKKKGLYLLKSLPIALYILIKTKQKVFFKSFLYYKIQKNAFDKGLSNKINEQIIFDQGPIFLIAMLIKEMPSLEKYLIKDLKNILHSFDRIIYLEASSEVLINRIENRGQEHRTKDIKKADQLIFLDTYISIYHNILSIAKEEGILINKINTEENNIKEVKEQITSILKS